METSGKKRIGFIGTGVMGSSMVRNFLKAGHKVMVYNRTREKAEKLSSEGAVISESIPELVRASEVVMTMVGYPEDVREIYLSEKGILANMPAGFCIDFTTSDPVLATEIQIAGRAKGIGVLDAPVSGGDVGAKNATLSIMVGGENELFIQAKPLLEVVGKTIVYQGRAGSGQNCKMCNQIAIASGMLGICEAIRYAEESRLQPTVVLESISGGAAGSWSLSNLAPRIVKGDYEPGFYIKHFIKDMRIAQKNAQRLNLSTPGLDKALELYSDLADNRKLGEKGTQALYLWFLKTASF